MKDNAIFNKLKRKPKWKLKEERSELQEQQKVLRMKTEAFSQRLIELKDDMIAALKANDGEAITLLENQIDTIEKRIESYDKRYKTNAEILEIYSKVVKNDKEGNSSTANTAAGWITAIGGLALGAIGLKKAYDSDVEGSLTNKKTLDWIQRLPIFRNFGRK